MEEAVICWVVDPTLNGNRVIWTESVIMLAATAFKRRLTNLREKYSS